MKRNNLLLLALTSAILSTWTVNAYAVQVCHDSEGNICETVELVSPVNGKDVRLVYSHRPTITVKFTRTDESGWKNIEKPYHLVLQKNSDSSEIGKKLIDPSKENITYPYVGDTFDLSNPLEYGVKYDVVLMVGTDKTTIGSFTNQKSSEGVSTASPPGYYTIWNTVLPPSVAFYQAETSERNTHVDFKLFSYEDLTNSKAEKLDYDDNTNSVKWTYTPSEDNQKPTELPDGRYLIYLNVHNDPDSLSVTPFFIDKTLPVTKVQTPEESKGYVVLKELKGNIHADGNESKGERYAHFEYAIKQGSTEVKTGEGYATEQGSFSLTLDNTLKDNGDYTLIIDARDQAGNPATTVEVPFKIEAPIITVTALSSSTESPTKLSGTGTPGTELTITFGPKGGTQDEITPKPVVGADGTWSVELSTPNDKTYTYKVEGAYIFGTADTDKKAASITGGSGEFTVTLPAPTLDASLAGEATVNTDYEVKGSADASTTVVITILDASGNVVGTAKEVTVGADGNWTTNVQFTSAATYKVKVSYKGINKSSEKEVVAKAAPSDGTQPGNGTTQPGNGTTQPGNGTTQPGNGTTQPGSGGQGGTQGGSGGSDSDSSDDGCGCATPGGSDVPSGGFLLALLGTIGWVARRRRK